MKEKWVKCYTKWRMNVVNEEVGIESKHSHIYKRFIGIKEKQYRIS